MPVYRCTACGLLSGGQPSEPGSDGKLRLHKCRSLNVKIQFKESRFVENYDMKLNTGLTIAELKGDIELLTGIPTMIQQVCFNDEAILYDNMYLHELNLVNYCTLSLTVRHDWSKLVEAVLEQDFDKLMSLGITEDSDFRSPSLDYIKDPERRKEALRFRATVALIIACHRGYTRLVKQLIAAGINVNGQTQFKRSALHIVAAKGQSEILDLLIHNGANIDLVDYNNETPLDIANRLEQTQSSRQLFLFRWQLRAKNAQPSFADIPMFPHQYFDSDLTIHFNGSQGQVYMMHVPPPGDRDRWKPRQSHEYVRGLSPTRVAIAADMNKNSSQKTVEINEETGEPQPQPSSAPRPSVSGNTVKFVSAVGASLSGRKSSGGKSPAFAYEHGIAPVGNKKEGKKSFEEWLEGKKHGVSRASSAFGSREGNRPHTSATFNSAPSRLMSSVRDRLMGTQISDLTSLFAKTKASASAHAKLRHQSNPAPSSTHYVALTAQPTDANTENSSVPEEKRPSPVMIPASVGPINSLASKYIRVKSASDGWARHDRDKSGYTSLWA